MAIFDDIKSLIQSEVNSARREGYIDGVYGYAKWLVDKKVDDYSDIVDLTGRFRQEMEQREKMYGGGNK